MNETHVIRTSYVDRTRNLCIGEDTIPINKTYIYSMSDLYKLGLREYGRCISKCYVDDSVHIGYVFQKRAKYEDTDETYLQETWLSVEHYTSETTVTNLPLFERV